MEQLPATFIDTPALPNQASNFLLLISLKNGISHRLWRYFLLFVALHIYLSIENVDSHNMSPDALPHRSASVLEIPVKKFPIEKLLKHSRHALSEQVAMLKVALPRHSKSPFFVSPRERTTSLRNSKLGFYFPLIPPKPTVCMSFPSIHVSSLLSRENKRGTNEYSLVARTDVQDPDILVAKHDSIKKKARIAPIFNASLHSSLQSSKNDSTPRQRWKYTRTKQIATLGPSSFSAQVIEALFLNGVDIFRLNFSHGVWAEKAHVIRLIREVEKKWKHPIAIMADLQGPKLRIGKFKDGKTVLSDGYTFRLDMEEALGDSTRVQLKHPEILESLHVGDSVLLDDGKLRLVVSHVEKGLVDCVVALGGEISDNKGINVPSDVISIAALSKKDKKDALFAKSLGVDMIALSFVQKPEDIHELRNLVGSDIEIVAKIEKPAAVTCIEDILSVSDGAMIARGDLGVEMNPEEVPVVQKRLVNICRRMGKPVIVATQMLASMESNLSPTRAEASDVATAIYDGADAVMLSGETAAGLYPIESVKMQRRIIESVEKDSYYWKLHDVSIVEGDDTAMDAISSVAKKVAKIVNAKAIVSFTVKGDTVSKISASRPHAPLMALTPTIGIARKLQLFWGVYPVVTPAMKNQVIETLFKKGCELAIEEGLVDTDNDYVVITAGLPLGTAGATNLLHACRVSLCKKG
ncbi:pyruvate kinase PyKII [Cardiosporidium cionae]|uniref:Pyruvate kinase n=1 Tax=Cardiosporidium cionae TaxID=476202 RepID=A0ABQ7J799_9APIC|nr:pyruvate kinase PyKII [Cardiosporidium cionae]|eukprot:KAF8819565.1 pyruvate kinase PyKII [Cardiosporidium cionae]